VTLRAWAAFAALALIWGIPYLLIKFAIAEISPAGVAWARLALGTAVLLPLAARRKVLGGALAHWRAVSAFALAELIVPFSLIALGERWISSSLTAILIATLPFMVILLGPLFGVRESLTPRRLVGLVCGFTGVVTLLGFSPVQGTDGWLGVLCVLAATAGYAIGSLIVQRHLEGVDELGAVCLSLAISAVVMLPFALLTMPAHLPSALALVSVIVLGLICTAVALWLYFYLVGHAGAARATLFTYVNPLVASLAGVIVLHESFALSTAAGMALILLGTWMAARARTAAVAANRNVPVRRQPR
jgi:drug/metabolite transporter (DMT)-like permease